MIGNVKKLVVQRYIPHATCTHCNEKDKLVANVYSEMFVLKVLPFAIGKDVTLECMNCKIAYLKSYAMSQEMRDWSIALKKNTKHPWYAYIGYGLIGLALFLAMIDEIKKL